MATHRDITTETIKVKSYVKLTDISAPSNPLDGEGLLYKKTSDDGVWWKPDSAGAEVDLTAHLSTADIQQSTSSVTTSTTANDYVDMDSMTLTTSTLVAKRYIVLFSAEFLSSFTGRIIHIILNVNGVDITSTERRVNYITSSQPQVLGTAFLTDSLSSGTIIKVRWHYENTKQLDCTNRVLIINGSPN